MRRNSKSQSAWFNPRGLIAFVFCALGVSLAMLSVAAATSTPKTRANIKRDSNRLLAPQSATDWSIVSTPNPPPTLVPNILLSMTCASASDCWAVGYSSEGNPEQTLIEHWNGSVWAIVSSPNTRATQQNFLYGIACSSANNCWAVGYYFGENAYQTLIEHWDGSAWAIVNSPNTDNTHYNQLRGVSCAASNDCWAVGYASTDLTDQTLIEHWDGSAWTLATSPNTDATRLNRLLGVTCASSNNCWSVGFSNNDVAPQTLIEHWNGAAWSIVTSPNASTSEANYLVSVTCASTSDCWSVGYFSNSGQTLAEHWDGNTWTVVSSPNNSSEDYLTSVTCVSSSDCWAGGYFNNGLAYQNMIQHWNGSAWAVVGSPNTDVHYPNLFTGVACTSNGDCWAAGYNNAGNAEGTLIEHWNGNAWSIVTSANKGVPQGNFLSGTACSSPTDCWAVGYYVPAGGTFHRNLIEHWNGTAWSIVNAPNNGSRDNQLYEVTCPSASNCWATGYYGNGSAWQTLIEHWDGNAWTIVTSPNTSATLSNYLLGITCSSASSCWAVGYANDGITAYRTLIEQWNGASWSIVTSPNTGAFDNILTAVTCASASNCFAVGYYDNGTVYQTLIEHWNGTAWLTDPTSANTGIMQRNFLNAVTCTSATDCWAVGNVENGVGAIDQTLIEHWDGTFWSVVSSPNDSTTRINFLYGVACASASNCWAVGYYDNGRYRTLMEHWDGAAWSITTSPNISSSQQNVLTGVTCPSESNCWASGFYGNGVTLMLTYPALAPPTPISVVSRKSHGAAGTFDVDLMSPIPESQPIECRSGGTNRNYEIVFTFPSAITFAAASATPSNGTGFVTTTNTSADGTVVTVELSNVSNAQRIDIALSNVSDGTRFGDFSVAMNVLLGDTTGNGAVNSSDIAQTQSQSGQPVNSNNFREDVTASGSINSSDIALVQSKSGSGLP